MMLLRWAVVFGILLAGGCATNPVTGKTELSLIPESQELAIGAEQYVPSQQSQGGQYTVNRELTAYVSAVGQRLAAVSDRQLPYEFVVLNNSVPNAWALPGGKIAVNRGLLVELKNEAELAAVLGHEIVHAAAKHGASSMQRGMLLQGLVMATALSSADSDYANYIVGGAQLGAQLVTQKYGRSAELEADHYGTLYMKRAGYNPSAAITLQETFVRMSEGQKTSWLDGLFASHPPSQERVDANRVNATTLGMAGELGESAYHEHLASLLESQGAYDAFDRATQYASSGEMDKALADVNRAIAKEPQEPRFYGLRGNIYLSQKKYADASREFGKALERDTHYYEYYLGRGLAEARLGHTMPARQDLERSNQLLPTALASNELGQLTLAAGDRSLAKQYFEAAMSASGTVGQQASAAFLRLDLPENPGKYIQARPALTAEGVMVGEVANRTNVTLNNVQLQFQVTANGQRLQQAVTIPAIGPGEQGSVPSGWKFAATDQLSDASLTVLSASLAN